MGVDRRDPLERVVQSATAQSRARSGRPADTASAQSTDLKKLLRDTLDTPPPS
jgi:hypothetical protein